MATGELVHVALQVLRAELVVGAVVAAFEERPERLDAVGMGKPVHVFANAVLDSSVVG